MSSERFIDRRIEFSRTTLFMLICVGTYANRDAIKDAGGYFEVLEGVLGDRMLT